MKNLIKIIAITGIYTLVASGVFAKANNSSLNVPDKVTNQFGTQYPGAKVRHWALDQGTYKATFKENGTEITATYDNDGVWEKSVTQLKGTKALPSAVKAGFVKSTFKNYYVDLVELVVTPSGSRYVLKVDNHNGNWAVTEGVGGMDDEELKFTDGGQLIKITDLAGPDEDDV